MGLEARDTIQRLLESLIYMNTLAGSAQTELKIDWDAANLQIQNIFKMLELHQENCISTRKWKEMVLDDRCPPSGCHCQILSLCKIATKLFSKWMWSNSLGRSDTPPARLISMGLFMYMEELLLITYITQVNYRVT